MRLSLQPHDELRVIDERHVRFLARHDQMVIAGMYLGWNAAQMADRFRCSEPTVRRVRTKAAQTVFDVTELEPTADGLRLWGERHRTCCAAGAFEMIENNQLVSGW